MTAEEAAYLMMSGGKSPVIRPLSVTENGTYNAPEGVDGYDPVYVNVPDRYDDGYKDGFDFATSFYENVIDETKQFVVCVSIFDGSDYDNYGVKYPGSVRWNAVIYLSSDLNTPIATYGGYIGGHGELSYRGKITNIQWKFEGNYDVLIFSTISYDKYEHQIDKTIGIDFYHNLTPNNTSVISQLPISTK